MQPGAHNSHSPAPLLELSCAHSHLLIPSVGHSLRHPGRGGHGPGGDRHCKDAKHCFLK